LRDDFVEVVAPTDFQTADRLFDEWLARRKLQKDKIADDIRVDLVRDIDGHSRKRYRVRRYLLELKVD
jgi:hypothetical protein